MRKLLIFSLVLVALAACSGSDDNLPPNILATDVVGRQSVVAFENLLNAVPTAVSTDTANFGFWIQAPGNVASFFWSYDFSQSQYDIIMQLEPEPFLLAGLDPGLLTEHFSFENGWIVLRRKLLNDSLEYTEQPNPLDAYRHLVGRYRDVLDFHIEADHHAIVFDGDNAFEWANDMVTVGATGNPQAADMVFVLNAEPLLEAGVNPEFLEGWRLVTREMMGQSAQKFVKSFDFVQ